MGARPQVGGDDGQARAAEFTDSAAIQALRSFFELLDGWERQEAERAQTPIQEAKA
jgi:hypothetical protein